MATVVQSLIEPNAEAIKAHLHLLFEPVREHYPRGLIEIAHGPDQPDQAAHFAIDDDSIQRAVEFALYINARGQNVYVGANPRKPTCKTGSRSSDADVEAAFFQFADIDDEAASMRARSGLPLKPNMIVLTGQQPYLRPHLYWQLDEPCGNMAAWRDLQQGIAQALDGDPVVINPSRIMRLAGTINYPKPHKLEKGYRMELTTLRADFADERGPVTPEEIAKAYPKRVTNSVTPSLDGQTTLAAMSRGTRIADLINACRSGVEWHNSMVRLVAHLASSGRTDAEILGLGAGLTLPGYTVDQTLREMIGALRTARQKWNLPEPADTIEAEEREREDGDSTFALLDMDELEALPAPTWLIDGLITDHGLSIVYGDPGAGKSFIVLDMALRIAYGMDWHGREARKVGVLYIAGEGARGLGKRVKGWRKEHFHEGEDAPFLLLPVAVQMLDPAQRAKLIRTINAAIERAGFAIGLVIIDTVSRAIAGQDENGQEAMSMFVGGCGEVQVSTGGAVIGVHHSGKDKERGMRGSTVLLGGCDASMKVTKTEQIATLTVEKQKDDEELEPINMVLKKVEWALGLGNEESTLVPMLFEIGAAPEKKKLSVANVDVIFNAVKAAWDAMAPWSLAIQAKRRGRFLPDLINEQFGISHEDAESYITSWQQNDYLRHELCDARNKVSGLRVLKWLER